MEKEIQALLTLVTSGLWEQGVSNLTPFPLEPESWERIYLWAKQQTVMGLLYRGIVHLPHNLQPSGGMMARIVVHVNRTSKAYKQQLQTLAELNEYFMREQLTHVLMKGLSVAQYYEHPALRSSGDIDFYFSPPDFEEAQKRVSKRLNVAKESDGSIAYNYKDICIEHHPRLLDLHSPFKQGWMARLVSDMPWQQQTLDNGLNVTVPAPELNLLLLNAHIMKHAIGWGIGLRQLCDLARAYHQLQGKFSGEKLHILYQQAGLLKWSALLHNFLVQYLGLNPKALPYAEPGLNAKPLLHIVLQGGNFGQAQRPQGANRLHTLGSFLSHRKFGLRYAGSEYFWTMLLLMKQ